MKFLKEEKAQGSLEMLLLVVAAIAIAAVVGMILKQTAAGMQEEAGSQAGEASGG
ncbi:MAG: class III signal peptide-containing protein [Candidatus Diapherotrites archaeon]|nr:class III signal peptide-containing protein [Candidatus Diapherotrites archaeon]